MKKRFHIEDIEKELGITRKTYYNWENSGKVPKAKRDPMSQYRYWTEEDLRKLKKITGRQ
jgi:DNA-binding transcriptional MerR regulator